MGANDAAPLSARDLRAIRILIVCLAVGILLAGRGSTLEQAITVPAAVLGLALTLLPIRVRRVRRSRVAFGIVVGAAATLLLLWLSFV